jgi:thiamine biosynthesis lipoprotein
MGTIVTFDLFDDRGFHDAAVTDAFESAARVLHHVDEVFSTWKPDSPVSRLRRGDIGLADVPDDVGEVLQFCQYAKDVTHGWFDPWSLPGGVDPTGYVKGWAAQRALGVLVRLGAQGAIVNAAGDIAVSGNPSGSAPFQVGIVNPFETASLACVARVTRAIATSGDYERGAHLLNPFTGSRSTQFASATVCGADLGLADALATALVVGGDPVLQLIDELEGYEALAIRSDRTCRVTGDFPLASEVAL